MGVKRDHEVMLLELARNAPPESDPLTVYNGAAPKEAAGPYVIARFTTTRPDGTSFTNEQDEAVTRAMFIISAGSQTPGGEGDALAIVADRLDAALVNVTPTIAGRACWPIRDEGDAPPPDWDNSTGVRIWSQRVVYRLKSVPA